MSTQSGAQSGPIVEPDPAPPPSIDEVKASIIFHHKQVSDALASKRAKRDELEDEIRELVAEEKEAARMVRALQPRKPKTAQPKGSKA